MILVGYRQAQRKERTSTLVRTHICSVHSTSDDPEIARTGFLVLLLKECPVEEGWTGHTVLLDPLQENLFNLETQQRFAAFMERQGGGE